MEVSRCGNLDMMIRSQHIVVVECMIASQECVLIPLGTRYYVFIITNKQEIVMLCIESV